MEPDSTKKMNFIEFDFYLIVPKIVGMLSIEKLGVGGSDILFLINNTAMLKNILAENYFTIHD